MRRVLGDQHKTTLLLLQGQFGRKGLDSIDRSKIEICSSGIVTGSDDGQRLSARDCHYDGSACQNREFGGNAAKKAPCVAHA